MQRVFAPQRAATTVGMTRWVQLGLALALVQLLAIRPQRAPVLILRPTTAPVAAQAPGLEGRFAGTMTPDDVARGILALSALAPHDGGLRPAQRAALGPQVAEAAAARAEVDRLRAARRAARDRLRAAGLELLAVAPSAARVAARQGAR